MTSVLKVGFVTGATPDKWARNWRSLSRIPLELVPLAAEEQEGAVRAGTVDMALVRLPVDTDDLHCVRLYEELQVAVASKDHFLAAAEADGITTSELAQEQLVRPHASGWTPSVEQLPWPPMTEKEAVETVAAGTGIAVMPMSVARLLQRKDVVASVVTDLPSSQIALVWLKDRDDDVTQTFVGVVRGRTAHSSR